MTEFPELLRLFPKTPVISIAGAGGKTTLMFKLADRIAGSCVVTTTTKVGADQIDMADLQFCFDTFPSKIEGKKMWVSPSLIPVNGKVIGCDSEEFAKLLEFCQDRSMPLIYEADGAACRHIKAPAEHEPVIMPGTNVCFYLVGLDVLGKPMNAENVHRPELFGKITGLPMGAPITRESILSLLGSRDGGLKSIPENARKVVYLTHADTEERVRAAEWIAENQKWYDIAYWNE